MKKRIKKLWLQALRSGKFVQGQGYLKKELYQDEEPRFCCLGVLCTIYSRETKTRWVRDTQVSGIFKMKKKSGVLPLEVEKWAGLTDPDPTVRNPEFLKNTVVHYGKTVPLSTCNDSMHLDFDQIADLIEESL